jgi:hypothetical protein
MAATRHHLLIEQGSDYVVTIPVSGVSGTLTDWDAAGQIRESVDGTLLHELSCDVGESAVTIEIPAATSSAWTWTRGVYDVKLTAPGGGASRLIKGAVLVDPQVTR